MLHAGDLIERDGIRWTVRQANRHTRIASLLSEKLRADWVPLDLDVTQPSICRVICNPPEVWPCLNVPHRARMGRLIAIDRSPVVGAASRPLREWHQWVSSDPMRLGGGGIFFDPALNLVMGEVLLATYEGKGLVRVNIPAGFATIKQRQARTVQPEAPTKTVYDHLLADDDDE